MVSQGLQSTAQLSNDHDLALVDLDGVVYRGHLPISYASESLNQLQNQGVTVLYATNNASRTPENVAEQLVGLGIKTEPNKVLTSAQACAINMTKYLPKGAKILVIGGAGLIQAVTSQGFQVVSSAEDNPAAVAQGYSPELGWKDLAEAAYAITGGATHFATNKDLSIPTARGYAPGNGTLVLAVEHATGQSAISSGKPSSLMYQIGIEKAQATAPLVIGDRLDTDLAGAREADIPGLLVFTGVNRIKDTALAPKHLRPSYIGRDLRCLFEAHPNVVATENGYYICNKVSVTMAEGGIVKITQGNPDTDLLDIARASIVASWNYLDQDETRKDIELPEFLLAV